MSGLAPLSWTMNSSDAASPLFFLLQRHLQDLMGCWMLYRLNLFRFSVGFLKTYLYLERV